VTWTSLVWRNLLRRPARTMLTAVGVGLGVGLIVALFAITNGIHQTARDLISVGRADFGLYQADVADFPRSLLPESLASRVASDPGVASVAKVKLLIAGGNLVFGLDPNEFAYRRFVVVQGRRGPVMAGDHSGKHVGESVKVAGRAFVVDGIYHSGDRFEDLALTLPLHVVERLAQRPGEITSIGVTVKTGANVKKVAARIQRRYPGVAAVTEPGQAIRVDTSSRLIVTSAWVVSLLALIVGGISVTNTMAMSVYERTREIGILRAVGWSGARVGSLIVSEAVGICVIALGVGCALGVLAAQLFVDRSALSDLVVPSYGAGTFAWGLAFALAVALAGALYPALRAIRLAPVAALRHE
jgi:putative ABC transport system permease protein